MSMGTDISYHAERRTARGWEVCIGGELNEFGQAYPLRFYCGEERNYALFAILAGVRRLTNGGFEPIVPPRGFPADSPLVGSQAAAPESFDSHNRTWLTLAELLRFPWRDKRLACNAYVDAANFLRYQASGRPENAYARLPPEWRLVTNREMERLAREEAARTDKIGTLITFGIPYAEFAGPFLTETLPRLSQQGTPEDVRLIVSFNS
jgi:hypothetical protein